LFRVIFFCHDKNEKGNSVNRIRNLELKTRNYFSIRCYTKISQYGKKRLQCPGKEFPPFLYPVPVPLFPKFP
jgi:hypothetical protein